MPFTFNLSEDQLKRLAKEALTESEESREYIDKMLWRALAQAADNLAHRASFIEEEKKRW